MLGVRREGVTEAARKLQVKLLDPPFDKSASNPGYIKGYVPYTHAAIWGGDGVRGAGRSAPRVGDLRKRRRRPLGARHPLVDDRRDISSS
ncbi:MAG TPA: hypothetical protein VHJ58_13095 [Vicinamibacterales bacterium]|jgi:hypothetical protein|nr:hypothetical protein [Vicinamibacterales bacterium]